MYNSMCLSNVSITHVSSDVWIVIQSRVLFVLGKIYVFIIITLQLAYKSSAGVHKPFDPVFSASKERRYMT